MTRLSLASRRFGTLTLHMQHNGRLRQKDLAAVIGSVSRASEVLGRQRSLTIEMIRAIHAAWSILLSSLIGAQDQAA
jgi:HTH-type transcriptional regulator/antitoxin HigA